MTIDRLKEIARDAGWVYNGRMGLTHQFVKFSNGTDRRTERFEVSESNGHGPTPGLTSGDVVDMYHEGTFYSRRDTTVELFDVKLKKVAQS